MQDRQPNTSRRKFFLTASTAGAAVASATWVQTQVEVPVTGLPKPAPEKGGGYTLSDHVKQYYKTTLV